MRTLLPLLVLLLAGCHRASIQVNYTLSGTATNSTTVISNPYPVSVGMDFVDHHMAWCFVYGMEAGWEAGRMGASITNIAQAVLLTVGTNLPALRQAIREKGWCK